MERTEVEGDAKSFFEAIKESYSTAAWPIQAIICDVVDFSKTFDNCNFN